MRANAGGRSPRSSTPTGTSIIAAATAWSAPPSRMPRSTHPTPSTARLRPSCARAAKMRSPRLAAGQLSEAQQSEVRRFLAVMDHPEWLRPTRPVTRSGMQHVAGRRLQVNLAPFAATEGDVWLYDPAARLLISGDLVVTEVPFMDTACAEGWRRALDASGSWRSPTS